MGLGHSDLVEDERGPPRIEYHVAEHTQRWLYRNWAEMMSAPTWADYKATHSRPEDAL
jgi:hypothetical protein